MKSKIWVYVSMAAIGIAIGILIGAKFIVKETAKVEYTIRKIKNKNAYRGMCKLPQQTPKLLLSR
jgi:uncharacterized membrane protein YciS (DUF1049 family)